MVTKKIPKNAEKFLCKECDFKCCKQSNYIKHSLTAKHKMITNDINKVPENAPLYYCDCGKKFKFHSGLSRHKKICSTIEDSNSIQEKSEEKPSIIDILSQNKELMNLLILQNKEHREETSKLQNTIMELVPRIGNTTTNNNNQFNLQVFLNEDCKNALNFSDFIKQIQVSLIDLENQAENGYIKGITKLFIENLQGLGINNRPIHCTDKKTKDIIYQGK